MILWDLDFFLFFFTFNLLICINSKQAFTIGIEFGKGGMSRLLFFLFSIALRIENWEFALKWYYKIHAECHFVSLNIWILFLVGNVTTNFIPCYSVKLKPTFKDYMKWNYYVNSLTTSHWLRVWKFITIIGNHVA